MDTAASKRRCLACQSKNLQDGGIGVYRHTFVPNNKFMWVGYEMRAYVCLDCGTVGYYLTDSDVQGLRKFEEKKK